jgi:integrase
MGLPTGLIQISGRRGYYTNIPIPRALRKALGKSVIQKKAGDTEAEARRALAYERAKAQELFDQLAEQQKNQDPVKALRLQYRKWQEAPADGYEAQSDDNVDVLTEEEALLEEVHRQVELKETASNPNEPLISADDQRLLAEAEALLGGKHHWTEWVSQRKLTTAPVTPLVKKRWETVLKHFSEWSGLEHPENATKSKATEYKIFLLTRTNNIGKTSKQSSIAKELRDLSAWWNWAVQHEWAERNIWLGLAKGLKGSDLPALPAKELVEKADQKAASNKDLIYLIQRFTGCRKQAAAGLRGKDIDLESRTIHFVEYEEDGRVRKLKQNQELHVPIHSKLLPFLKEAVSKGLADGAMWPEQYKPSEQSWGDRYADRFTDLYGFNSHDLRRIAETDLARKNINPYFTYYITGHRVPGSSEVTQRYVRPTVEELREAVEAIGSE